MGYRFLADERTTDGVRRVACEQVDKAVREIDVQAIDLHETIHQVRKRCKKLRGLLRLVRPVMEDVYRAENAWYRDYARALSNFRDAQALIESFDALCGHFDGVMAKDAFETLRRKLSARRDAVAEESSDAEKQLTVVREDMLRGRERIGDWPLAEDGFGLLRAGLEKTYRRGRKAMRRAYREWSPEAFHEWRKRVKYHWYHARLLEECWPGPLACYAGELKKLSDFLGDDHDLAVLRQALQDNPVLHGMDGDVLQAFFGLMDRRQAELRHRARPLGERIFVEKPQRLGRRLRGYWDAWRFEQSCSPRLDAAGKPDGRR